MVKKIGDLKYDLLASLVTYAVGRSEGLKMDYDKLEKHIIKTSKELIKINKELERVQTKLKRMM